jgi:hypothetical protein
VAAKGSPCLDSGEFPAVVFQLTIHENVVNARRKLVVFSVGSVVNDGGGIEDGDVREISGLQ